MRYTLNLAALCWGIVIQITYEFCVAKIAMYFSGHILDPVYQVTSER